MKIVIALITSCLLALPCQALTVPESIDAEIQSIAKTVGDGQAVSGEPSTAKVVRLFNWVRNNIDFELYCGLHKGPQMTYLERGGNDVDQVALLRELLIYSGFPKSDISIVMRPQKVNYTTLQDWMGLSATPFPGKTYYEAFGVAMPVGSGGSQFPVGTSEEAAKKVTFFQKLYFDTRGIDTVGFDKAPLPSVVVIFKRCWLRLKIGSTTYDLDPSYKTYSTNSKISDSNFLANIGYDRGLFLDFLAGTSDANTTRKLDQDIANARLNFYTKNLQDKLRSIWSSYGMNYLAGGRRIIPLNITDLSQAFPLGQSFTGGTEVYNFTGTMSGEATDDPLTTAVEPTEWNKYKSTVTFAINNNADVYKIPLADLKGSKVTLTFDGDNAELRFDDSNLVKTWATDHSDDEIPFKVDVDPAGRGSVFSFGGRSYRKDDDFRYAIVYGFNANGRLLQKHNEILKKYLDEGLEDDSREVRTQSLNIMGLTWLYTTQLIDNFLVARNDVLQNHHVRIGRMAQEEGFYIDVIQTDSPTPNDEVNVADSVRYHNVFSLGALFNSAMEHAIIEQMQPGYKAVSTVNILRRANNMLGNKLVLANSANWTTVKDELEHYPTSQLNGFESKINSGCTLFLPLDAQVNQGIWHGSGWVVRGFKTGNMTINGGYNGGYSTSTGHVNAAVIYEAYLLMPVAKADSTTFEASSSSQNKSTPQTVGDPVDISTGAFLHAAEDMSAGIGEAPWKINFVRQYSSMSPSDDQNLGYGWTHNFHLRAQEGSIQDDILGKTTPLAAAPFLVAAAIAADLYRDGATPREWGAAVLTIGWLTDIMTENSVTVTVGKDSYNFIKQPDGTYMPPVGTKFELVENGTGYIFRQRLGNSVVFNGQGRATRIEDPDGTALELSYNSADAITQIVGPGNLKFSFIYPTSGTQKEKRRIKEIRDLSDSSTPRSVFFTYDSSGNMLTSTDPGGVVPGGGVTYYDYSVSGDPGGTVPAEHRIVQVRNHLNQVVTKNQYDALGRVTKQFQEGDPNKKYDFYYTGSDNYQIDPEGGITHYFYDSLGRPIGERDAVGNVRSMTYDTSGNIGSTTTAEGETTNFLFDALNNIRAISYPRGGGFLTNYYDSLGRLDRSIDPNGAETKFNYFASGPFMEMDRPQSVVSARGSAAETTDTFEYYTTGIAKGKLFKVTDGDGRVTQYNYDTNGFPYQVIEPGGFTTTFTYSDRGDLKRVQPPNGAGSAIDYTYNGGRKMLSMNRGVGTTSTFETRGYDFLGRLETVTAKLATKTLTYSPSDQVLLEKVNGATVTEHQYDRRDLEEHVIDAAGRQLTNIYEANGDLKEIHRPGGRNTSLLYDGDARVRSVTNPGANTGPRVTGFVYDTDPTGFPRTTFTDSDGKTTTSVFDRGGNLLSFTDKKGGLFEYTYDRLGRIRDIITPYDRSGGRYTRTTYTANGRVSGITEPSGDQATFGYFTSTNRLQTATFQQSGGGSATVSYTYDSSGNLLTTSEAGPGTITRTYDGNDRVTSCTASGTTLTYAYYTGSGLLSEIYYSASAYVHYAYWPDGRLGIVEDHLTPSTTRTTRYYWRTDGLLDRIVRPNGTIRQIGYDVNGRQNVITEKTSTGTIISEYLTTEFYPSDQVKSLTVQPKIPSVLLAPVSQASMTFDSSNLLATFNGQNVTSDFDGNMTTGPLPSGTFGAYTYDSRNRLISAGGLNYSYDAESNLIGTSGTVIQNFVVDSNTGPSKVLSRTKGGQTTKYVYGLGLLYEVNDAGNATYYHYDRLGNTVALTNSSESVVERVSYSPHGQIRYRLSSQSGTPFDTPFLFGGQLGVITDAVGLNQMRARFYNPAIYRFINSDPARAGSNWFSFADGDPMQLVDPSGLNAKIVNDAIQAYNESLALSSRPYTREDGSFYDPIEGGNPGLQEPAFSPTDLLGVGSLLEGIASALGKSTVRTETRFVAKEVGSVFFKTYRGGPGAMWINETRGVWNLTIKGSDKMMRHSKFGLFLRSKSDGTWWTRDVAGHGGSAFKVYRETGKGLQWIQDADQFGDYIVGKHKGNTGLFIPWKDFSG